MPLKYASTPLPSSSEKKKKKASGDFPAPASTSAGRVQDDSTSSKKSKKSSKGKSQKKSPPVTYAEIRGKFVLLSVPHFIHPSFWLIDLYDEGSGRKTHTRTRIRSPAVSSHSDSEDGTPVKAVVPPVRELFIRMERIQVSPSRMSDATPIPIVLTFPILHLGRRRNA